MWNFPRGAIRVLLRKPAHLQDNFRACLKIYPITSAANVAKKPRARIYLEAPHRLISLFGGTAEATERWDIGNGAQYPYDGEVLVKCFRSVNGQVALYVEAEGEFQWTYRIVRRSSSSRHYYADNCELIQYHSTDCNRLHTNCADCVRLFRCNLHVYSYHKQNALCAHAFNAN